MPFSATDRTRLKSRNWGGTSSPRRRRPPRPRQPGRSAVGRTPARGRTRKATDADGRKVVFLRSPPPKRRLGRRPASLHVSAVAPSEGGGGGRVPSPYPVLGKSVMGVTCASLGGAGAAVAGAGASLGAAAAAAAAAAASRRRAMFCFSTSAVQLPPSPSSAVCVSRPPQAPACPLRRRDGDVPSVAPGGWYGRGESGTAVDGAVDSRPAASRHPQTIHGTFR